MPFSPNGATHRSTATGTRGMVASAHPLATLAGLRILMDGGNAIDSAVATAAALNVVEPYMSGLAGVGYMHVYNAANREHKIVDYVGLTPATAELSRYDGEESKNRGPLSPLVPGSCGGWLEALSRYGTMDPATVFAPAIDYAEHGFALTVKNFEFFSAAISALSTFPSSVAAYLPGGRAPQPGQVLAQPDLAHTFRLIADYGAETFYRGEIAQRIVQYMDETGGLITSEDLDNFSVEYHEPIHVDYRGYRIYTPPPPCQALQFLMTFNLLEAYDITGMGHNTADTLHHFIEAVKLATADRAEYSALDRPPTVGLLSKEYATARRQLIGERARPTGGDRYTVDKLPNEVTAGDPYSWMTDECTTHFDTIDVNGNAVSVTQSLGSGFGSAMVVPETGLALNNFMRWYDLNPESPNAIGPSRKNEMCLSPVQIWDADGLRLLIGTPGGHGILQTTPQMIMNVLDHGMNLQAAIEAPRLKTLDQGIQVDAESRIPANILAQLEQRGHTFNLLGDWSAGVGGGQGIMIDPESGSFMGGADPRRDGFALGW